MTETHLKIKALFEEYVSENEKFKEAFKIASKNSGGGNIWVTGGAVFRTIISKIYGEEPKFNDFDFILEKAPTQNKVIVPPGWKITKAGLGCPRLIKGDFHIDLIPLDDSTREKDIFSKTFKKMNSSKKLFLYFKRVPLNIQALVYDVKNKKLIGRRGLKAIKKRTIKINDQGELATHCKKYNITVIDYILKRITHPSFKIKL